LPVPDQDVLVGIGDDVAVLDSGSDQVWLATCDVQVEGAHFLRAAITPTDLGRKSLAINLSDVASAGGYPRFALISLGLPEDLPVEFIDGLYKGLRSEAEPFGVEIVGGNISGSKFGLFIDIFLLGKASRGNYLLRSGAHAGDQILVTGTIGDAAVGVALLQNPPPAIDATYAEIARGRLNTPTPRVHEGQLIGKSHLATAMIDISDGLAGDLGHICERSKVGVRLEANKFPVAKANRSLAKAVHGDEWHFALHGGEDYELLFTAPKAHAMELASKITQTTGTPVTIIGEILPQEEGRQLVLPDGQVVPLATFGWDHFKEKA